MAKLRWLNGEHLRSLSPDELQKMTGLQDLPPAAWSLILPRAETLTDINDHASYLQARPTPPADLLAKHADSRETIQLLSEKLAKLTEWRTDEIKAALKQTAKEQGIKFPQVGMPLRVLLTAREHSPDIAEVAEVLGKEETLARMKM